MTWWLSASSDELAQARTCTQCGCRDADIDLNMCFQCWSQLHQGEQFRKLAGCAMKYGRHQDAEKYLSKAAAADAERFA